MNTERTAQGQVLAADRDESDTCERGTPGCCVDHTASRAASPRQEGGCETW